MCGLGVAGALEQGKRPRERYVAGGIEQAHRAQCTVAILAARAQPIGLGRRQQLGADAQCRVVLLILKEGQGTHWIGNRGMTDALAAFRRRVQRQAVGETNLVVESHNGRVVHAIRAGDLIRAPRLRVIANAAADAEISDCIIRAVARQQTGRVVHVDGIGRMIGGVHDSSREMAGPGQSSFNYRAVCCDTPAVFEAA